MVFGVPNFVKKIAPILRSHPALEGISQITYRKYLYMYLRTHAGITINIKNSAKVDPFNIIWINPNNVSRQKRQGNQLLPKIKNGNWDLGGENFENHIVFRGFKQRYKENKLWEETVYYQHIVEKIGTRGKNWKGIHNKAKALERLYEYDNLVDYIEEKGFLDQVTLEYRAEINENLYRLGMTPPELREIVVDIGRDGEFIHRDGSHRLAAAKVTSTDLIPVRVRWRHTEWQNKRNSIAKSQNSAIDTDRNLSHPDLESVL